MTHQSLDHRWNNTQKKSHRSKGESESERERAKKERTGPSCQMFGSRWVVSLSTDTQTDEANLLEREGEWKLGKGEEEGEYV